MRRTVLAYGETLWDLLPSGALLGGAPFNFAYRVNCLGDRGLICTRLGRDQLGREAFETIRELGMDAGLVQWDEQEPTGTVEVDLSDSNAPSFFIVPGVAYDNIRPTEDVLRAARQADCVCYGTLAQRTPAGREALESILAAAGDGLRLLDINLRPDCWTTESVRSSLERADILKLNEDEARELDGMLGLAAHSAPAFAEAVINEWGLYHCVVTFGERGAYAASAEREAAYVPGYRVELADTCGSGDAFTAGFVHRLMRGRSLAACCALGNALGALVATQDGATATVTDEDVRRFLATEHARIVEPELEPYLTEAEES
jgi:fructokinase